MRGKETESPLVLTHTICSKKGFWKILMQIIKKDRAAMIVESNQDIKKIDKLLKKLSYKSYYFSAKTKKLKPVNKKYPLNTFFLQKKHLS